MLKFPLQTGPEAFDRFLHVGRPNIGDRQRLFQRLNAILDRQWLTNQGPEVKEFEDALCHRLNVKHCISICNGTVALEIAIRALDLHGEVILPSFTFIATAHALTWLGLKPVFCDIDRSTFCADPADIEKKITPRTSGIIGVHLYNNTCDVKALQALAQRHKLKLMYDAAHAFGASHDGTMIGNFGNCEVFSFHATKFFNSFEGGAITTNDDELARKIRLMHNFGFSGLDCVVMPGTNGKMTEICAAMGLTGLESLDQFIAVNRANYQGYLELFSGIPGLHLSVVCGRERTSYQYITAQVGDEYPLTRDALMHHLHKRNVMVRRYFWPGCHRMEPYKTTQPDAAGHLPVTEAVASRMLVFPTGNGINLDDIAKLAAIIRKIPTAP